MRSNSETYQRRCSMRARSRSFKTRRPSSSENRRTVYCGWGDVELAPSLCRQCSTAPRLFEDAPGMLPAAKRQKRSAQRYDGPKEIAGSRHKSFLQSGTNPKLTIRSQASEAARRVATRTQVKHSHSTRAQARSVTTLSSLDNWPRSLSGSRSHLYQGDGVFLNEMRLSPFRWRSIGVCPAELAVFARPLPRSNRQG